MERFDVPRPPGGHGYGRSGQAEARCDARTSSGGHGAGVAEPGTDLSGHRQGDQRRAYASQRRRSRRHSSVPAGAARSSRIRIADCLRQRGEPAAGTRHEPNARAGNSYRAWSHAWADGPPASYRKRPAGSSRGHSRGSHRDSGHAGSTESSSRSAATDRRDSSRPAGPIFYAGSIGADWNLVRSGAGDEDPSSQPTGNAEGRRPWRERHAASDAERLRGRGNGTGFCAANRGGPDDPQLGAAVGRESGI